jgi:hypothetical protein
MKNQYVGDINDYVKYALLRALAAAHGGRLHVCWMLADADGRSDGGQLAYLGDTPRFRDLDPPLFDALAKLVSEGRRDVLAVEAAMILPDTTFHADTLLDVDALRQDYFDKLWSWLESDDLIFFDPDNGLEVPSRPRGRRDSSMPST